MHRHSYYEPCIVLSGSGEFEHQSGIFPLQKGDLFIANPDTWHEIRSLQSRDLKLFFFCFYLTRHVDESHVSPQAQLNQSQLSNFLIDHLVHIPAQSHLTSLFEHAMKLMQQKPAWPKNPFYHEATLLLLGQIVSALTETSCSTEAEYTAQIQRRRIGDLIEQRLHEPLRVVDLARACGMSERSLRRKWRECSDHLLLDEISQRRVERACQLLLLPDISIADVGHQVGVPDPAQFSRLFKKIKSCTPRSYRHMHLDHVPGIVPENRPFQTEYLEGSRPADLTTSSMPYTEKKHGTGRRSLQSGLRSRSTGSPLN